MNESYKREYEIGEVCWINMGDDPDNPTALSAGQVVHSFELPHHANGYFVIEMTDMPDHMNLEIRDALLMSPEKNVLPPWWTSVNQ